jgi:hypothetical protein
VRRLVEREPAVWAPLALHLPWEARDGWTDLERLAEQVAPHAAHWADFLDAVEASRHAGEQTETPAGEI